MNEKNLVGVKMKEIATREVVYQNCTVLNSDSIGLLFEVERTIAESGNIEHVVSQLLIPWININHVLVMEERT